VEADLDEKISAVRKGLGTDIAGLKKGLSSKTNDIGSLKKRLDTLSRLEERLRFFGEEKDEIARNVSSLQNLKAGFSEMEERTRNLDKEARELKSGLSRDLGEIRGQIDSAKSEKREKFDTAVKAFLNSRSELNNKTNALNIRLMEMGKRMDAFSRLTTRIDMLEKKMDRITERSSEMRRDVDKLETKEGEEEKIAFVDLGKDNEEV